MSVLDQLVLCALCLLAACGGHRNGDDQPSIDAALIDGSPDAPGAPTGVDVLTQHNDLARTGANIAETELTADNVASPAFGKLFTRDVDDQIYAQPLIVSGLDLGAGGKHDVLYTATVGDSVYAFDATDPAAADPLWHRTLLATGEVPVKNTDMTGACNGHYTDFSGNIGIVGTPVIDRATHTMYVVARARKGGTFTQRLHALDIVDGHELPGSPVTITASVPGTGDGSVNGKVPFDPLHENQRAALTLVGGVVYITWGGHCDWSPYHGWIMGYDATTLAQVVVHNTTPYGGAGGVWQSGQGLSSDGTYLYAITGNGTVGDDIDPTSPINRGESFLKLSRAGAGLHVESWFTPFNWQTLEDGDLDLGSAGMLLIPGTKLAVSGGKGGWLYVVDRDNMGGLSDDDASIVQTFALNDPNHLHGSPIYWNGPSGGLVYALAEEDYLKGFPVKPSASAPGSAPLDVAHMLISDFQAPHADDQHKEMPGGMLSLSANGNKAGTGIVWASLQFSGDANQAVRPGVLRAFDATDLTRELWQSRANAARDDCGDFAKFSYPTIANGKVYLASFSNQLCVYGLSQP